MVIDYLDLIGIAVAPLEADPPLVVDANAVLACPVTRQFLQAVAWWNAKVVQGHGRLDEKQLPQRGPLEWACELLDPKAPEETFRLFVAEAADREVGA